MSMIKAVRWRERLSNTLIVDRYRPVYSIKLTQRGEDVKMDKMDEFSELMKDERDIENQIKKLHREIDALEFQRVMIARRSSKIFRDIINKSP